MSFLLCLWKKCAILNLFFETVLIEDQIQQPFVRYRKGAFLLFILFPNPMLLFVDLSTFCFLHFCLTKFFINSFFIFIRYLSQFTYIYRDILNLFIYLQLQQLFFLHIMFTPYKATHKILNSSCTPYSLASSKVSTNCDLQKSQGRSTSRKKFTRKREGSNDSLKRFRAYQTQKKQKRNEIQVHQNVEESFKKADELLEKLSIKKKQIFDSKYVKLSTDRSRKDNEELFLNQSYTKTPRNKNTERIRTEYCQEMNVSMNNFRLQLQMKDNQCMIMSDQNNRLKKQIKSKEGQFSRLLKQKDQLLKQMKKEKQQLIKQKQQSVRQKQNIIREKQQLRHDYQMKIKLLHQKIKKLQFVILQNNQTIQKCQKNGAKIKEQLKKAQNQNDMLKIHIDQLMSKKVSKDALQIISYRQASLQNQLNQLKKQLSANKSQRHIELEFELEEIKQKIHNINHQNSTLSVANRVLIKKTQSVDGSLQKKSKGQINDLKQKMKQIVKESAVLKKQNVALRKNIYQYKKRYQKGQLTQRQIQKRPNRFKHDAKKSLIINDENMSDDSFSFSLSR